MSYLDACLSTWFYLTMQKAIAIQFIDTALPFNLEKNPKHNLVSWLLVVCRISKWTNMHTVIHMRLLGGGRGGFWGSTF